MQGTVGFFEHQDRARQNTVYLLLLFAIALLSMTVLFYLVLMGLTEQRVVWRVDLFSWVVIGMTLFVGCGSAFKFMALRGGGGAVAASLGGQLVLPETQDPAEQQLLNVVEEMAIASGITVPLVYRLPQEPGINAFAAGFSPNDAVIGVTQGTLDQLNREELQGVIGHEFSHILNGDMRLNLRLIGVLQGILLIYLGGRIVLRMTGRSRNSKSSGGFLLFGLSMLVIGWAGMLCGRMIKSAVARQREFLADASAVQFTRNPMGIASALRKIGGLNSGSQVQSPKAEEVSHLFFGEAMRGMSFWGSAFATHPPLKHRIQRLERLAGQTATFAPASGETTSAATLAGDAAMGFAGGSPKPLQIDADTVVATVGTATPGHLAYAHALLSQLPPEVHAATKTWAGAIATSYGLLVDPTAAEVRDRQLTHLRQTEPPELVEQALRLYPLLQGLDPRFRLPLLDLTIPALRNGTAAQCSRFLKQVQVLVQADQQVTLAEYTLQVILHRRLASHFAKTSENPVEFTTIEQLWTDCITLLSALAQVGEGDRSQQNYAFRSGMFRLPGASRLEIPQTTVKADLASIGNSLKRLRRAAPKLKQAAIDACAHTVLVDNDITLKEAELLRAVVIALDCPIPPFLDATLK